MNTDITKQMEMVLYRAADDDITVNGYYFYSNVNNLVVV